jgi:hypothetical protein
VVPASSTNPAASPEFGLEIEETMCSSSCTKCGGRLSIADVCKILAPLHIELHSPRSRRYRSLAVLPSTPAELDGGKPVRAENYRDVQPQVAAQ